MRIALTGVTGFIGRNLLPMLLQYTSKTNAYLTINRQIEKANELFPKDKYRNFEHVSSDNFDEIKKFNPQLLIHLATLSSSRNDEEIIHPMLMANIEFGVKILSVLSQCPDFKLFVNVGTFAEYRYGNGQLESAYLYSASKTAFRTFLEYYASLGNGFDYINVVPYSVYGGEMTVKRLFDYLKESMDSPIIVDMTGGEQVLDFIHVDDVARFFVSVVNHPQKFKGLPVNEREFHLGTGKGTSIRDVVAMIEKITQKKCNVNWGGKAYRDQDIMYSVAPIGQNHICGWKAKISLLEGLSKFLGK